MSGTKDGFLKAGHLPTLVAALLYFDVSFMTWVLMGPLAPFLRDELHLDATTLGLITAVPLLGGSFFRPVLALVADRIGGRRTAIGGMLLTLVPLGIGWQFALTSTHLLGVGLLLGVAGASFAVALPLASRWYPPQYQGLAMGIAGAGNSGTLLTTLAAPRLAEHFGWQATFGFAMLPMLAVFIAFVAMARDSPATVVPATRKDYARILGEGDTIWLSVLYGLTFGGFVGLASFLTIYFHEQYALTRVTAGDFTTIVVVAGSLLRPIGGWLSDRIGGYRLLLGLLLGSAACFGVVATAPPLYVALAVLFVGMGMLGMGNGAVFQLVPQRFPTRMGLVTGIVGAAGGLGGFFLPTLLGAVKDATGHYSGGFFVLSVVFAGGAVLLLELGARWARAWTPDALSRSGVFSYREKRAEEEAA
ncbi:MAG: MFS transporter [Vicinamibacterales bacterium]